MKLQEAGLGNIVNSMPGGDVTSHYKANLDQVAAIVREAHAGALREMDEFNAEMLKKRVESQADALEAAKKAAEEKREEDD